MDTRGVHLCSFFSSGWMDLYWSTRRKKRREKKIRNLAYPLLQFLSRFISCQLMATFVSSTVRHDFLTFNLFNHHGKKNIRPIVSFNNCNNSPPVASYWAIPLATWKLIWSPTQQPTSLSTCEWYIVNLSFSFLPQKKIPFSFSCWDDISF